MAVRKEIIRTGWSEAGGVLMIALCALLALSLLSYRPDDVSAVLYPPAAPPANLIGPLGAWIAYAVFMTFGGAGYFLLPMLFVWAGFLFFQRTGRVWPKAVGLLVVLFCASALMDLWADSWEGLVRRLNIGSAGGWIGEIIGSAGLAVVMGRIGATVLAIALLLSAGIVGFGIRPVALASAIGRVAEALVRRFLEWQRSRRDLREQLEIEAREIEKKRRRLEKALAARPLTLEPAPPAPLPSAPPPSSPSPVTPPVPAPIPTPTARTPSESKPPALARRIREEEPRTPTAVPEATTESPPSTAPYRLPPLSVLATVPPENQREIRGDLQEIGRTLVETLVEFGIETQLTNVEQGPVVTRFELLPAPGVRVERIAGLSNNIALALKAESVRVQAPIPGKGVVGIEVPNIKTTLVCLREILESEEWRNTRAALPLAIGKDVGGRVIISDLSDMPHLLIAGATGSGKTVCMNALLTGLLMSRTPDQLRLLLVDPKIVEFSAYNHLPHLVAPVITDPKKVALGLRWAITEMEKRYKLFARVGVRNIKSFNARPIERQAELFPVDTVTAPAKSAENGIAADHEHADANEIPDRLPYIVIVVDELADLMLVAQADIENSIARLAQLSRAVGIHMVLATQRPSVNVITGTIKANFPARIAFQVAQKVDSRTILDANGADKLLGKGDMLFLPPGTSKMIRAQGCMVSDAEVLAVVDFIRAQSAPRFETDIKDKLEKKTTDLPDLEEDDELIEQAIEIIRQTQRASTSSLQRRLRIGYTRAARIMDLLEERGIVGPAQGSDPREILIDLSGEIPKNDDAES